MYKDKSKLKTEKMKLNKGNILKIFLFIFIALSITLVYFKSHSYTKKVDNVQNTEKNKLTDEFKNGPKIEIKELNKKQTENLYKLCKIWGFVKYYHPKIASGDIDWDYELFKVMPQILNAKSDKQVDNLIYDWINKLGSFDEGNYVEKKEVIIQPDTEWIKDTKFLTTKLSNLLVKISGARRDYDKHHYLELAGCIPKFTNEHQYMRMEYSDDGCKLLSLFRYWNIIEYFFPYKDLMDKDWDIVLKEFIPKMIECDNELSYKLTIAELTTRIQDSHAELIDTKGTIEKYYGKYTLPIEVQLIENKVVVTKRSERFTENENLQVGDIILEVNGKNIFDVIHEKSKYIAFSNAKTCFNKIAPYFFRTDEEYLELLIQREDTVFKGKINCVNNWSGTSNVNYESHKLINNDIGYIGIGGLLKSQISNLMEKFKDTKGLIIDLREYPCDNGLYNLAECLMPKPINVSKFTCPSLKLPGEFVLLINGVMGKNNPDYYKGKVIIIINEYSMSASEYATMALRVAPNATVIGSNSTGADGNVVYFMLPGSLQTRMSGLGVYYPDGGQTQRVGIAPDIIVKPTIEGIRAGRDELIEKAIECIEKQN